MRRGHAVGEQVTSWGAWGASGLGTARTLHMHVHVHVHVHVQRGAWMASCSLGTLQ